MTKRMGWDFNCKLHHDLTDPRFRLGLFGQFRLIGHNGRIELGQHKPPGLLAWLACAGPEPQQRERVMALLWGSFPERQAHQSLRQALMGLRRILGNDAIVGGHTHVGIRPGVIDCDITVFERLIGRGDQRSLDDALKLYVGPFLANIFLLKDEEWTEWAQSEQQRLNALALGIALKLSTTEFDAGRWQTALEFAQRAITIDNLREEAHRLVIIALMADGRHSDALKHFDALTALLKKELDVTPDPATHLLMQKWRGPMTDKHRATELPTTRDDAIRMAVEREAWAIEARGKDLHGAAKEQELTALLLRKTAERLP